VLVVLAVALVFGVDAHVGSGSNRNLRASASGSAPADPAYLPWYTSVPTPLAGAYVSLAGAFAAGNFYNTSTAGGPVGTGILDTGECHFVCFGAPGAAAHHLLTYGNDVNTPGPDATGASYTHNGAPDDCTSSTPPPTYECPGGIRNQVFGVTVNASPEPRGGGYVATVDESGSFGALRNLYAGAAVIAGAGTGTPEPSPSAGSLVSHTGAGTGDILLGSAGAGNYVKCDYGETVTGKLVCDQPLVISSGGIQPNGPSNGFVPEAYPLGVTTPHPQIMSGSCTITGPSGACMFPNGFSFADTS
jgi:hypothetical protein